MILYCTLGAIFLGIVIALILYCNTKKGTIRLTIDITQNEESN